MLQQIKTGIKKSVWLLFIIWGVLTTVLWLQAQQTIRTVVTLEELNRAIDDVRGVFVFGLPHRSHYVERTDDQLQQVKQVRLQLEQDNTESWASPDLTQLIYITDRFLEGAHDFVSSDKSFVNFTNQLSQSRIQDSNSPSLNMMYYQLEALLLEAMFNESSTNTDVYQQLDQLFKTSQDLASNEQQGFQRRLAETSNVLATYAQSRHLIRHLFESDISEQFDTVMQQLEQRLKAYINTLVILSVLFVIGLILALMKQPKHDVQADLKADSEPVTPHNDLSLQSPQAARSYRAAEQEQVDKQPKTTAENQSSVISSVSPVKPAELAKSYKATTQLKETTQRAETTFGKVQSEENKSAPEAQLEASMSQSLPFQSAQSDEPYIDIAKMLDSLSGDEEAVQMLLGVFIEDHADDSNKFKQLLLVDPEQAQRITHSLKGVAGSLGAMPLQRIAAKIELLLKNQQEVTEAHLERLTQTLAHTITYAAGEIERANQS